MGSLALVTAAQARPAGIEAAIAKALEGVTSPVHILRASDALAALGPAALEPLFAELCASAGSSAGSTALRSEAVLGALDRLPRADLVGFLTQLSRSVREDQRRETALELLGRLGGRDDLKLALELGMPGDPATPPGMDLQRALERALLGICERDPGAVRSLAALFARVAPGEQATVARVIARTGREEGAGLLAAQLGQAGVEADSLLLLEFGRMAPAALGSEDLTVLERVREMLGHPDARLRVLACLAVENLRDHEAVPELVVLLEDQDSSLRQRAHAALVSLTGLTLPPDPAGWLEWLSEGLEWWDERAEPCRIALVSGTAVEAAASVREIARQRLFVHHAAGILALAVQRPEPDIVKSACVALGAMREAAAQEALLSVVDHSDPTVAEAARAALWRLERARTPDDSQKATLPRLNRSIP